jgi:hypothetical protein
MTGSSNPDCRQGTLSRDSAGRRSPLKIDAVKYTKKMSFFFVPENKKNTYLCRRLQWRGRGRKILKY